MATPSPSRQAADYGPAADVFTWTAMNRSASGHHVSNSRFPEGLVMFAPQTYAAHPIMGPEDMAVAGPKVGVEYMTVVQYLWNKCIGGSE